jgi:polar amino acid transport system substrate-binding protein
MTATTFRQRLMAVAVVAVLASALTACSGTIPTVVPEASSAPSASASASASAAPAAPTCDNATQSYAPTGPLPTAEGLPEGSTMAAIRARGRLIVGVSADTYLLGARNPLTGQIEGFDIDLAKQVAKAILGNENAIQLVVITAADRIPALQQGRVDIVVRNMTMNCARWQDVAFSQVYYQSGQKLLVRRGSPIKSLDETSGVKVCAPKGTTTYTNLTRLAPSAVAVGADNHTGCLVLFQQGDVDAITGDDTVLAGLAAQDPYAVVTDAPAVTEEPYGVATNIAAVDLVRFVNQVLEAMRADGRWTAMYNRWLAPTLGTGTGQPTPTYGRG